MDYNDNVINGYNNDNNDYIYSHHNSTEEEIT